MMETIVCWCTTITMMETIVSSLLLLYISRHNGSHHCYSCTSTDTMVSIIVIVVHQQTQWFPSLLLLYISRHIGFHHCYSCTSTDTKAITMMETIVSADVQQ
jgi:inner membrane protein involved in colicin E2 resistance